MQAIQEPLPESELIAPQGLFLITEDQLSVASYVADSLHQMGAASAIVPVSALSPQELAEVVAQQRQIYGSIAGIIHLAPLAALSLPDNLSDWRQYTQIQCKSLFHLIQLCAGDLQQQQSGWVLAASLLGGYFGREGRGDGGLPTGGSNNGFLKSLITELPNIHAKAVDFDSSLPPSLIAQHIVKELLLPGGRLEVGYPQGNRTIFQTVPAPLRTAAKAAQLTPSTDWVVLVTGGARGITAEIAKDLASLGLSLILVGRSAEPIAENVETADIEDVAVLRQVLVSQARSQGHSPTPVQIERQLQGVLRDRTIRHNLEQFRQAGANVEYLPVDVRNAEAFGALIDGIYTRYGRLDAVIHGAGIIEDKLIADKSAESFARVFDTKVDSTFILSRHLRPDLLKLLVLFSSVAGRYGNRGQSDYAAANEVINRLAWQLDQTWSKTRVVAINWGPWDTTGMASEGVKRQFRERGIIPIPLSAGRQFFFEELRYGCKGETEVIAGEGPWEAYEAEKGQLKAKPQSSVTQANKFVFLSFQPQLQPNSTVTLEHTFSLASDPYLGDHCLDGKPVLPATGALEWMAEFVQAAWSEWAVTEVRDLRVMRGLVLETDAGRNALFSARASSHADSESLQVAVEILDSERKLPFYRATVVLRPQLPEALTLSLLPLSSGSSLDITAAYRDYLFHGSRFQLVTAIDQLSEQGLDARVMPSQPTGWLSNKTLLHSSTQWLFDPGLVDTAPQLAIIWNRVQRGATPLPSRFGAVVRYGQSPPNGQLQVALRVKPLKSEHSLVYDAVFLDELGKVRLHLQDVESTCNTALNRLAKQP
ncbi:MAG: SDR family NAD(P)-dependent oxidoreductase [Microcoleus sp. SIO2G3]|nr:SDR family NAD(P)-dependent oxidoreductase [Microcoleus sp. SIO2G3]